MYNTIAIKIECHATSKLTLRSGFVKGHLGAGLFTEILKIRSKFERICENLQEILTKSTWFFKFFSNFALILNTYIMRVRMRAWCITLCCVALRACAYDIGTVLKIIVFSLDRFCRE